MDYHGMLGEVEKKKTLVLVCVTTVFKVPPTESFLSP